MLRIGLTGGIGAGKSTVSNKFYSAHNIPIIDADEISRQLMAPNGEAYEEVAKTFGPESIILSGEFDRKFIRDKIFKDKNLRTLLENIIHPKVRANISHQAASFDSNYCLIVVPLLIESNMQSIVDRVLVIDTQKEKQISRVTERDRCYSIHVQNIMDTQIDPNDRLKYADDIIVNNSDLDDLDRQIQQLHQKYLALSK